MFGAVILYVLDRFFDTAHHFDPQYQAQPLPIEIIGPGRDYGRALYILEYFISSAVRAQFHSIFRKTPRDGRQKVIGNPLVNEHRVERIAHTWSLYLCVLHYIHGPLKIRRIVDEYMADPHSARYYWNRAVFATQAMEAGPPSRDDHIDILVKAK
jgi:hypothetical protein